MKTDFDLIILGGGSAGLTAAKFAKGIGKKVAIIENKKLGGECTWTGCVPSKTLIKSAEVAWHAKELKTYGLSANSVELDTSNVLPHIHNVIKEIYQTHTPDVLQSLGITVMFGEAQFIDKKTIRLNDANFTANKFIIATGSSPFVPPIQGLETTTYHTNETIFELKELPKSLIILGGGAIGAELSSAFNRLGVQVTIIEMNDRILAKEDEELVGMLAAQMEQEGVQIKTGMKAVKVDQEGQGIKLTCEARKGSFEFFKAEQLLVAVGRKPNIDGLALEKAGVKTHRKGVIVNNYLRTTARNIFACGDVIGPYQFSHMAFYQAVIAARNALIPIFKQKVSYEHKIWATFTAPELATMGLTEREAREKYGDRIAVYKESYKRIDRAHNDRTLGGTVKVVCDKKGYILGAQILGERAADIIHELQVAKVNGVKFHKLSTIIHAYPTYAELIWHMAKKAYVTRLEENWLVKTAKRLFKKS